MSTQAKRLKDGPDAPHAMGSLTDDVNVLELSQTGGTGEFRAGQIDPGDLVNVEEMLIDPGLSQEQRNLAVAINQLYETFITNGEWFHKI